MHFVLTEYEREAGHRLSAIGRLAFTAFILNCKVLEDWICVEAVMYDREKLN